MATYLKRTSKLFELSLSRPSADVRLRDLVCPVCRGILIEPVTLPCTHNLCLRCLKGTLEHNSLSCPLCRVRVSSWVRTATKSETLVNHGLWELIRTKFPKEVEDKHNGEERDLGLDAEFATTRILSAAGEIHREYEAQLQIAEEEMRRQRQEEQRASEALIQKIQAEEKQMLLAQLAQDQLLAKSLAKKQVAEKQKETKHRYVGGGECLAAASSTVPSAGYAYNASKLNVKANAPTRATNNVEAPQPDASGGGGGGGKRTSLLPESVRDGGNHPELRRTNMALLSKICAERYCKVKTNTSNAYRNCCPKQLAVYNVVTKSFKQQQHQHHQAVPRYIQPCSSGYPVDPGCSTSGAYATETKEELRVPSDVVNSQKKKSLGVEVCRTHGSLGARRADDDERIGSAESSGSHDSINQEIHHFKPIKTVPRTSFKISSDGKQIDPKLIRVVPVVKRVLHAVLKPPSPTHLKRIIGCSWSAFRGKARQDALVKQAAHNVDTDTAAPIDQKPSTSLNQPQAVSGKSTRPQTSDGRVDFVLESSFDSNKNYTKSVNKIVNGTKVSKKLSLDDESDARTTTTTTTTTRKSWRTRVRNGMVAKSKARHRNVRYCGRRGGAELTLTDAKEEADEEVVGAAVDLEEEEEEEQQQQQQQQQRQDDEPRGSGSSCGKTSPHNDERHVGGGCDDDVAVENIAERIKKRKVNAEKKTPKSSTGAAAAAEAAQPDASSCKRSTRKRALSERRDKSTEGLAAVSSSRENAKLDGTTTTTTTTTTITTTGSRSSGSKRRRTRVSDAGKSESSANERSVAAATKRSTRAASSTKVVSSSRGVAAAAAAAAGGERYNNGKYNYDSPPESSDETEDHRRVAEGSDDDDDDVVVVLDTGGGGGMSNEKHERLLSDEVVIREQERIEQMLLQEREDHELARRLQAQFDEMEHQVARRTRRGSRRAVEDGSAEDAVATRDVAAARVMGRRPTAAKPPSLVARTAKTVPTKKRGRPPKRVK